ncbi:MAG: UDP-N-acetylmuramoyl-L-alanine--D-glutamate ligase [Actinobacteria bacterium]|nr:UDP-N-acetylmuramoyl-L-alanine--D-glutamate ligase [Actinomycetota bacterium]
MRTDARGGGGGAPSGLEGVGRALVLGLARSGVAASLALARHGIAVVGVDRRSDVDDGRLREAGVEVVGGAEDPALLDRVDLLVKSPGVRNEAPLVVAARERGVPVWSEVELGYRLLPNPIVGVTGTNGKTTTTELLGLMFEAADRPAEVAGNVGRALCELDGAVAADVPVVCELSSFQLEDVDRFRPRAAVLLNVTPDHLDRHGSFEAYRDAKLRMFANQTREDVAVVPRGFDPVPGMAKRIEFSADDELPEEPFIRGEHNRENAAAATAAARAIGIAEEAIGFALRTFPGVPHRLEPVRELGGVLYVNDSKATNPEAAERALSAYVTNPVRLILGGSLKGASFDRLAQEAGRRRVVRAYLIGAAAPELAAALARAGVEHVEAGDLESAVRLARADAEPGDVVLLSPACASFDQFRDYEERGRAFRLLVEAA